MDALGCGAGEHRRCGRRGGAIDVARRPEFVGDLGEKGKAADERNDMISFANGQFHSAACDKWNFSKAKYTATKAGDAIAFEAETVSDSDGRMVWRGTVKGDELEGTFVTTGSPRGTGRIPSRSSTG
jgi:hypothetical protein